MAHDPQALSRFQRDAQAPSALNRPNICTIHDTGEENGRAFIAMEYLEGAAMRFGPGLADLTSRLGKRLAEMSYGTHIN